MTGRQENKSNEQEGREKLERQGMKSKRYTKKPKK
jgi:hypothetical protein